jgi:hypothetical protein
MLFRDEDEDLEVLPFADRAEAGRTLAGKLSAFADRGDAIVLGLHRGGVTVASGWRVRCDSPWMYLWSARSPFCGRRSSPWERWLEWNAGPRSLGRQVTVCLGAECLRGNRDCTKGTRNPGQLISWRPSTAGTGREDRHCRG